MPKSADGALQEKQHEIKEIALRRLQLTAELGKSDAVSNPSNESPPKDLLVYVTEYAGTSLPQVEGARKRQ